MSACSSAVESAEPSTLAFREPARSVGSVKSVPGGNSRMANDQATGVPSTRVAWTSCGQSKTGAKGDEPAIPMALPHRGERHRARR